MFAIIDIETTGLSPKRDRIIEVALILTDGHTVNNRYQTFINPQRAVSAKIFKLTGIAAEMLSDAPLFHQVARRIIEMTEGCTLVAHNARFDTAFLSHEFRRLGYHFHRKQLCTMRLAKRYLPEAGAFGLANLCRHLEIKPAGHHRAMADAEATLALFQRINQRSKIFDASEDFSREIATPTYPPSISVEQVDALPNKTGVYLFYGAAEKLLYIGKSREIRKRVMGHFSNDLHSTRSNRMKSEIQKIDYRITGSDLVALLLESDLIKKRQPPYNRAQRTTRYRYGLFSKINDAGYREIFGRRLSGDQKPLLSFSSRLKAEAFLDVLVEQHQLCQKLCGLYKLPGACFQYHLKKCNGACQQKESPSAYNLRVEQALQQFHYFRSDFAILGEGRTTREHSLVMIERGRYCGFGFIGKIRLKRYGEDREFLRKAIEPRPDNPDVRRIIRQYLNSDHRDRLITFPAPAESSD